MSTSRLLGEIREKIVFTYAGNQNETLQERSERVVLFLADLQKSVDSGDPGEMISFLDDFISEKTPDKMNSYPEQLNLLFRAVLDSSRREYSAEKANQIIADIFPIQGYAFQYIYRQDYNELLSRMNREQAELEKLDKSKSDFISIAAHELKTPLTLLEGYTSMMREILEQKQIFDEHLNLLMDGMNSGSRRLREIISDMIDVSLIDNQLLSLNFQPTWLHKLLDKIVLEYRDIIESRHMSMEVSRFNGDENINYYDGERIFQAISNVVSNAIKYTPDGGKVTIEGRMLEDCYELFIIDNGIGVDPINQSKIFSKFDPIGDISLHSSGKTKFKGGGPGLGLPIAKGIIEAHGGRIWVESDGYDEIACPGSTFHILLPLSITPPDQAAEILFNPRLIHRSTTE
jgi:signal transduction histidine kinase